MPSACVAKSRSAISANFARLHPTCPCQKQPFTKTTVFHLRNTRSGRPGNWRPCNLKRSSEAMCGLPDKDFRTRALSPDGSHHRRAPRTGNVIDHAPSCFVFNQMPHHRKDFIAHLKRSASLNRLKGIVKRSIQRRNVSGHFSQAVSQITLLGTPHRWIRFPKTAAPSPPFAGSLSSHRLARS